MSAEEVAVAERVCTARQLEIIELRNRGAGFRMIGTIMGIARSTARDHWEAALLRVARELTPSDG